jgi:hypothetical protein
LCFYTEVAIFGQGRSGGVVRDEHGRELGPRVMANGR